MKQKKIRIKGKTKKLNFSSNFDVLGSYTGIESDDAYEKPIQDVDDL